MSALSPSLLGLVAISTALATSHATAAQEDSAPAASRAALERIRSTNQRRLTPGEAGVSIAPRAARAEVARLHARRQEIPAGRTLLHFSMGNSLGRALARGLCGGRPLLVLSAEAARCSDDLSLLSELRQRAQETRQVPWRSRRTYWVSATHSGNRGVVYFFDRARPRELSSFLDRTLTLGSPFVYHAEADAFASWTDHFEREVTRRLPTRCQLDPHAQRWLDSLGLVRSFDRRHSYMSPQEYRRQRGWIEELEAVREVLSSPLGGQASFVEAVHCVAHAARDRPWAYFDAGLLIDILAYEAQAVRRDPLGVLTSEALEVRQLLFNAAFARALSGHLTSLPEPRPFEDLEQVVGEALGEPLRLAHGVMLEGELLGRTEELKQAVRRSYQLLEPRRADQPIFPTWTTRAASVELGQDATRLYAGLRAEPPQGRDLPTLLRRSAVDPRSALLLLGGFAANRFYALYDLSPALVDAGLFAEVGPLLFWGASLHFLLQLKDLERIEAARGYFSLPPESGAEPTWPLVKNYHFWTEALLGCRQRDAGTSAEDALDAARVIGAHYRYGMTLLYLPYQLYHRGDPGWVWEDNTRAIILHERGGRFGYDLCLRSSP